MENRKNKILKPLRIDTELFNLISKALNFLNKNPELPITQMQFRRWALKHFSEKVLTEGLTIELKPKQ